jgi:hypothetical protein
MDSCPTLRKAMRPLSMKLPLSSVAISTVVFLTVSTAPSPPNLVLSLMSWTETVRTSHVTLPSPEAPLACSTWVHITTWASLMESALPIAFKLFKNMEPQPLVPDSQQVSNPLPFFLYSIMPHIPYLFFFLFQYKKLGTTETHKECEQLVARFLNKDDACIFGMGYATNSTNLPNIVGRGGLIVSDALNHASLVIGMRCSDATVKTFKHNGEYHFPSFFLLPSFLISHFLQTPLIWRESYERLSFKVNHALEDPGPKL